MFNVEYMTNNYRTLEALRHEFGIKHGFCYKRAQHYKDCIVIHWKHRKKRSDKSFIDYERISDYVAVAHAVCDKYELRDDRHPLLDPDLMLAKIGIYCFISWHRTWAIPNVNKDVQDFVLSKLPDWAEVRHK